MGGKPKMAYDDPRPCSTIHAHVEGEAPLCLDPDAAACFAAMLDRALS